MTMKKRVLPEGFNFDVPSVEIIDTYSKGLNKTAMLKRASAFDEVLDNLVPKKGRTYLHVITTGAQEVYNANANGDDFPETFQHIVFPYPENKKVTCMDTDGGLLKYHDSSYMDGKAAVYQEHHSDEEPSGEIVIARYNKPMHRGELIIAVDTEKWAPRLQRKAQGQNIYLSMGCEVKKDTCRCCGREAHTMAEHCDHFKHHRCQIMDDGTQCSVINDAPKFYDISGVDVPADRIAFVLRKVASGAKASDSYVEAYDTLSSRPSMLLTKSARMLSKLSAMEKRVNAMVQGDSDGCDAAFEDDGKASKLLILKVRSYPADEVIDSCSRKGILLSPGTLFKLLGSQCPGESGRELMLCDDGCCGDCSAMLRELAEDGAVRDRELLDGSFDQHFPVDIVLDSVLENFMPDLCMSNPAVGSRVIRISIAGPSEPCMTSCDLSTEVQEALRRAYARYFLSFAEQNDDATCMNALRKVAHYGKRTL